MKTTLAAIALLVIFHASVLMTGRPPAHTAEEVLAVDREIDRAWNTKDLRTLESLWGDDYFFIGWKGDVMNKAQRLQVIRSGAFQVQSVKSEDLKARLFKDLALVNDLERIQTNEGEIVVRSTRVFLFRQGRWQLINAQKTRVAKEL